MTSRVDGDDTIVFAEIGYLMFKIVAAFPIAVKEDERLALAFFNVVELDVIHGA